MGIPRLTLAYLASARLAPLLILLAAATVWFGVRRVTRENRVGYALPTHMQHLHEMSAESATILQPLLHPGERAWEPLAVTDWETRQREPDGEGIAQTPDEASRWLVLTTARVLAIRTDGALDVEIPITSITNLGLAPLPGNFTRKRSGIAIQADTSDGHRRWLWGSSAKIAPGWVLKARDVIQDAMPETSSPVTNRGGPDTSRAATWPLRDFAHPDRVDFTTGHHMRPLRESDVDLDYPAVMGSRDRLWAKYREAWGWPPPGMTYEEDRRDLARHEREIARGEAFVYAIFDGDETELVGCLYIDPPEGSSPPGTDAVVSWWLVDHSVDGDLDRELPDFVPRWLTDTWGFRSVHYHP